MDVLHLTNKKHTQKKEPQINEKPKTKLGIWIDQL